VLEVLEPASDLGAVGSNCANSPTSRAMVGSGLVVIGDAQGSTIAEGQLAGGLVTASRRSCEYHVTLTNVPEVAVYEVTLGNHGTTTHTLAQLRQAGWTLSFSLS
jgi:hypothetical protein